MTLDFDIKQLHDNNYAVHGETSIDEKTIFRIRK